MPLAPHPVHVADVSRRLRGACPVGRVDTLKTMNGIGTPPDVRLHVVTGKGGTGKTTVAAALALALASGGRRILLCEVEDRQGIAVLFDVSPLPYAERRIAIGPGGGEVYALAIDPEAALLEYLDMFYRLGRAGKALDRFGVIDFATTVAPGLRDVLLTGKVYEAARRRRRDSSRIVRRCRPRRPADRSHRPLPQRQHRGRWNRQGWPGPQAGRLDHDPAEIRRDPRPYRHDARGDARAGMPRRRRRAHRHRTSGRLDRRQSPTASGADAAAAPTPCR